MPPASEPPPHPLSDAVALCLRDEGFLRGLAEIYRAADGQIARLGLVCLGGGTCCRFDRCGHRLYVSTGELAALALEAPPAPQRSAMRRCAYQSGGRCTARLRRPLGCRIHFCRPGGADLAAVYESHHRAIRLLHEQRRLPYAYKELTACLAELWPPTGEISLTPSPGTPSMTRTPLAGQGVFDVP